jgi:hypothetical protein
MTKKRIIFIHGLRGPGAAPMPPKDECLRQWRDALRKSLWVDIPDNATRMAYWADYRTPAGAKEPGAARLRWRLRLREARSAYRPDKLLRWTRGLIVQLLFDLYCWSVRRAGRLLCRIEKEWLRDYYVYFNVEGAREHIRGLLEKELDSAAQEGDRVAVVAHSMGTVIALDALYNREAQKDTASQTKYGVDLFVTMGSPLGLTPVQIDLTKGSPANPKGYAHPPFPGNVRHWLNVFDGIDTATLLDRRLGNDFTDHNMDRIVDRMIRANVDPDGQRDPHHWYGYLSCEEVGDAVSKFWVAP